MESDKKLKGPASYFPSIEKTYGKPISHWFGILESTKEKNIWSRWRISSRNTK